MRSSSPGWESGRPDRGAGPAREPDAGARNRPGEGSRFVAFLFADLRGYTAYTRAHGPDAAAQLAAAFAGITGEVVTGRGGLVVGTWGDEVLAEFPSARDAVRAGLELQDRCRVWTVANPGAPLAAGIGLDVGEPADAEQLRASEALNLAARLCAVAGPGEVLASRELMHLAGGMRGEITSKRRRLRLKGVGGQTDAIAVTPTTRDEALQRNFRKVLAGLPAARRQRRQRILVAAVTVVALVAGGIAAWLASSAPPPPAAPRIPGQALGAIDANDGRLLGTIPLSGSPGAIAASPDGRQVWVTEPASGKVVGVDTATRYEFQTIPGQSDPRAVAVARGYVWIVEGTTGMVREYTTTGQLVAAYRVGADPSAIAYGFRALWVANQGDGTLTRIPASGNGAGRTISVGASPSSVTTGDHAIWVANRGFNTVTAVDPSTLQPDAPINVGAGPASIAATPTGVWVADSLDGTLDRINPATHVVTGNPVGQLPTAVAAGPSGIWVGNTGDATISATDPTTGQISGHPLYVGSAPYGLALTGSTLWAATQPYPSLAHRGGTLTIANPNTNGGLIYTIDPAIGYGYDWTNLGLVFDGLVSWNRAPGVAGTQLVPDLARALPMATDGGRTYQFTLRRGIRYSNGMPLRASDIRRGLERTIAHARLARTLFGMPQYFAGIVGAATCSAHPKRCNLTAGIQTDDAARTVTFHLTAPDPDFLAKLATGSFAAAVPPGTPMRGPLTRPIPGTGPYKISRFVPRRRGHVAVVVLRRNPYFPQTHPWSLAAQPPGYPNVIRYVPEPSTRAAVSAVLDGRIDVTYPNASAHSPRAEGLPMLTPADRARQLHTQPSPATEFVLFNARRPPFNDFTARQAAAYAFSSDPNVRPILGIRPACTLAPPAFPGHSPGCAYHHNLALAKRLVVKSGTAGQRVAVYAYKAQPFINLGRETRRVLSDIGYRASLYLRTKTYPRFADSRRRPVNVELYGWSPDVFAASQFYAPLIGCRTGIFAHVIGCNRAIDKLANRALQLQSTAPGSAEQLWESVYRRVDVDARIVPRGRDLGISTLLSKRTRNFIPNATNLNEPLLDQLWVK